MYKLLKKIINNIQNVITHNSMLTNAVKGYPRAQVELAEFYLKEKKNFIEAYAWAEVACFINHPGANTIKKLAEAELKDIEIKEAWDKARLYKKSFLGNFNG